MLSQRGVALAILLWMMAALSILVAGIVFYARTDIQLTRFHLEEARAEAASRGSAHLIMREMLSALSQGTFEGTGIFARTYEVGSMEVSAQVIPLSGLIDINNASEGLLADLLTYLGQMDEPDAQALAADIVTWRSELTEAGLGFSNFSSPRSAFMVTEDLLKVPGVSRGVYDRIVSAIHAQSGGGSSVDLRAANPATLTVLAKGDGSKVDFVNEARQDAAPGEAAALAGADINGDYLGQGQSGSYQILIRVSGVGERTLTQRIWVKLSPGQGGTPWQFVRMEPVASTTTGSEEDKNAI